MTNINTSMMNMPNLKVTTKLNSNDNMLPSNNLSAICTTDLSYISSNYFIQILRYPDLSNTNAAKAVQAYNKINKSIEQIKNDLLNNCSLEIRLKDWQKLTDAIEKGFYIDEQRKTIYGETYKVLDKFFRGLTDQKGVIVTDRFSLERFLSKFPKMEAVYLLELYVQTYTKPDNVQTHAHPGSDDDYFYTPEEFDKTKVGDCKGVAWYCHDVLSSLGISSSVLEINFDIDFILDTGIGAHAATQYDFTENGKKYFGVIDNSNVDREHKDIPLKRFIHEVYPHAKAYREVDLETWKTARTVKRDKSMLNPYNYTQIKLVYRTTAKAIIGNKIPFELIFDNPKDDIMYFKRNADRIIMKLDLSYSDERTICNFYDRAGNNLK